MEEIEVPTEHLHEEMNERAEEAKKEGKERWIMGVAISTALMAVFAALGSLQAGHHSNEALIQQIKSSDQWAFYQAKGIKYEILQGLNRNTDKDELPAEVAAKAAKYKADQQEIMQKAKEAEEDSELHLTKHVTLAKCVTLFQISIAISAISMLTRKRFLWYFSVALSLGGLALFIMGNM